MRDVARCWRCLVACFSLLLCLGVSATAHTNDSSASLKGVVTDPEAKAGGNASVLSLKKAPGTFSTGTNGPGLGDTKTFFRGFKDGQYSMTYDGIPFNDTNDPTHHSWAFFPAQTIGSTVFDRSPGSAATIGPSTYGGSGTLLSRSVVNEPAGHGTNSYGPFHTNPVR